MNARAREAVRAELERGLAAAGYAVLGWSTLGLIRPLSKGKPIRSPDDLRGARVYGPSERLAAAQAKVLGHAAVHTPPQRVLQALRAGQITVVQVSAHEAVAGRWAPYLDHIGEPVGVQVGVSVCAGAVAVPGAQAARIQASSRAAQRRFTAPRRPTAPASLPVMAGRPIPWRLVPGRV